MIVISARIFGLALATWHIALGINLPQFDWHPSYGMLQLEVTTGAATLTPPSHSEPVPLSRAAAVHEQPAEGATPAHYDEAGEVNIGT